jgi:RNA polymerase-interacting CarD/CdnL/TRCF family regulator
MTEIITPYSIGDWVVHHAYGIGQIKEIEEKPIHGELVVCFQVKTHEGAYWWFPRNGADNPRIRPVASQNLLQRAQKELQEPVQNLDPDRNMWRSRIDEVRAGDDLIAITQMVRDLTILKTLRKLNQTELKALSHFKDHLLGEWSATMNTEVEAVRQKLNQFLRVCKEQASV